MLSKQEYTVFLISDNGTRKSRVLGLDRHNVYNSKKKNTHKFLDSINYDTL